MDLPQQLALRDQISALLFSGMRGEFGEEPYSIKDKVSKIVVSVAARTWPQNWPEFWPMLEALLNSAQVSFVFIHVQVSPHRIVLINYDPFD